MGKIDDIVEALKAENPDSRDIDLLIYANALSTWREATDNIFANGVICAHPRTGAPMQNPYLAVQAAQATLIAKMRRIKSDKTMSLLAAISEHGSGVVNVSRETLSEVE